MKTAFRTLYKCRNLEKLILRENNIRQIPNEIGRFKYLKLLDLSLNKGINVEQVIKVLSKIEGFEVLILSENNIHEVPESITQLKDLKELHLQFNPLNDGEKEKLRNLLPGVQILF